MRRKGILIILMLLVSTTLVFVSKGLQKNEVLKQESGVGSTVQSSQQEENKAEVKEVTETVKEDSKPNTESSSTSNVDSSNNVNLDSNGATPKTVDTPKVTKPQPKATPTQAPNIIIIDTVSGKVILSKTVTYNGETVAQATTKVLDASKITYKTSIFGDKVYFSSINGIKERSAGSSSGWCYFINGKKLNLGAGSYKLNKEDKLEWKFLKDGVSN